MSQRLMIKWGQHVFNMMSELPKFLNNKQYTDVTLSCNGTNIEAHKVILALASEYFRTSLLTNSCPHPFYVFKDLHYLDVKAVLDFVYTGKVSISENRLAEFKKVVDTLQIKGFYDASIERSHPDDHPKVNKYKKRRNRGHRGAATHSKASLSTEMLPDLDVVHEIYRKNPSSPAENIQRPSASASQSSSYQQPESLSGHQNADSDESDSDIEFLKTIVPAKIPVSPPEEEMSKQDADDKDVPEASVKMDKSLPEKVSTNNDISRPLECQMSTEDQPANLSPDKSFIPEVESHNLNKYTITTDDVSSSSAEDQAAKQEIENIEDNLMIELRKLEDKNFPTDDVSSSSAEEQAANQEVGNIEDNVIQSRKLQDNFSTNDIPSPCLSPEHSIADQLECSSGPNNLDQSSAVINMEESLNGLAEVTYKSAIAIQPPECPSDVSDGQDQLSPKTPDTLEPPAKRQKTASENGSSDDEDHAQNPNSMQ